MSDRASFIRYVAPLIALGALTFSTMRVSAAESRSPVAVANPRKNPKTTATKPVTTPPPTPTTPPAKRPDAPADAGRQVISADQAWGQVNGENVNVRMGASTQTAIITTMHGGEFVKAKASQNGWLEIEWPQKAPVYVAKDSVQLDADKTTGVVSAPATKVMSGTAPQSTAITKLDKGAKVNVVGEERGWYKITAPESASAFISAKYVLMGVEGPQPAPSAPAAKPAPATQPVQEQAPASPVAIPGAVPTSKAVEKPKASKPVEEPAPAKPQSQSIKIEKPAPVTLSAPVARPDDLLATIEAAKKDLQSRNVPQTEDETSKLKIERELESKKKADEEKALREAETKKKAQAEEQARREAEVKKQQEIEAAHQAELKKKAEAEELARREEAKKRAEAEEFARKEAEAKRAKELEATLIAEAKKKAELEEIARKEAETKRQQAAEAARQAELKKKAEEIARREADAKRAQELEAARQAELKKKAVEEQAARELDAKKKAEAEELAHREDALQRAKELASAQEAKKKAEAEVVAPKKAQPSDRGGHFLDPEEATQAVIKIEEPVAIPEAEVKAAPAEKSEKAPTINRLPEPTRKSGHSENTERTPAALYVTAAATPVEEEQNDIPELSERIPDAVKRVRSKFILPTGAPVRPGRRAEVVNVVEDEPAGQIPQVETPATPAPSPRGKPSIEETPVAPPASSDQSKLSTPGLPEPTEPPPISVRIKHFQSQIHSVNLDGHLITAEGTLERPPLSPVEGATFVLMSSGRILNYLCSRNTAELEIFTGRRVVVTGVALQGNSSGNSVIEVGSIAPLD